LQDDPGRAEVLGDLERSVGDKLAGLIGSNDRLVSVADIDGILEEIGAVDTGQEPATDEHDRPPRRRRLQRIREGQWIAGVCNGLADYSELRVDWVRTLFIFATLFTAGGFALVYIALAFILPVASTREA
jgi:phage shock protein PspC (stress-responsive transcriptional regulator)